jgi:NAD(P)-dependent dehydrogenase (short-subunit alcohol dehydrogenase family)
VHQLTRHVGRVLAPDHVTVNAIAPGLFPSKMTAFMFEHEEELVRAIPLGRAGTPEDIAGTAIYLASRAGAYTTGAVVVVDGGIATLA